MPRFSVIVPAYKVQAYLQESLDSVLSQSFTDLEVIAVDDASADGCGAIVDAYAAKDPRVTAVHLPHNVGLGPARNAGLDRAVGDYVLFLDGDDTFAPGALQAIADRLKATGSPDVLVHDYARAFWTGEVVRNRLSHRLAEDGPASFRLADRPSLLGMLMVVWNKAYRREFVEREGLRFAPGFYEDVAWTYPALLTAESVAVLDRVCVHYRQRRTGSILTTTTRRHLDVLDQYERLFGFLAERPELQRWRPTMHRRMAEHFCALYADRRRLPRSCRAEFFRRAAALLRTHRAKGSVPLSLSRTARLRHALMRLGLRRTYRTLSVLRAAGLAAGRAGAGLGHGLREAALRLYYRLQRMLPLRPELAVFSAYWHGGYACNPAAIEAKLRELAPRMRTAWICDPAHRATLPPATTPLRPGSAAYYRALARATYLVTNVNVDRALVKRPGQVLVQTQHGTPLKRVGLDLQDRPAASPTADFAGLLRGADQWDYLVSANRHSTLVWEKAVPASYTTLEYGYPRNDVFHHADAERVREVRERLGVPAGTTAILYAPTHRDYRRSRPAHLDFERVLRDLGPRFVVLARGHLTYGPGPLAPDRHPRLIDVSAYPSVEELCLAADALVTDYSSLMFDYAALDRPIVIHADDWEAYEAARGTYFDLRAFPPGAVARTQDELVDIFTTGHWQGSRSAQLRAAFRARFCALDDGYAAERVVRHVFLGQTSGLPPFVPLEERRPAPAASSPAAVAEPLARLGAGLWP
ncbi:bifunctional glycosyltransferase/CDP-glycerol:glycerophosphate glycerophosphotransferase [Streptomyces antimicrobicus]|uniref:Bifunctional glycosyltransferase family 2 protein/CDP-glycerol:glycerophosphate glycerophosphotransferase n=1 Tax=Streptomyces antimicrobicus TaxID=2883108 RepID=A0ABS8BEW8_9ACTN|nr:bifunctional glycosyltransferase family 2 protein/CDP-glycerol:glycerophosphate glycerophosphotransferase [Streptomyces antimicrobicus]MCB5183185.1 bifunctional glycosyltransferase family 2 protein/CDP-glycerol:glycerophosphate glycerophosphotransferase [Streptomyces antimicrobicus]